MFDHILVPLDGSSLAECVLPHTVAVARAFGARVTLLRVVEGAPTARPVDPLSWHIGKAESEAYLEGVALRLQQAGLRVEGVSLEGQAAERTIEFVRDHDVDLLLLSSHGRSGLSGWNMSSIVQKIILRAYVPVMIVRAYQPVTGVLMDLRYKRLLVPLDYSRRAECALPLAAALARFHGAELLAVHVMSEPQMLSSSPPTQEDIELVDQITERGRLEAAKYLEQLQSRLDMDIQTRFLVSNDIAATLHDLVGQEDVDLVVMSAHGYSGGTRWPYDNVVINLITYGTMPLLIIQDLSPDEIAPTRAELAARGHKGH